MIVTVFFFLFLIFPSFSSFSSLRSNLVIWYFVSYRSYFYHHRPLLTRTTEDLAITRGFSPKFSCCLPLSTVRFYTCFYSTVAQLMNQLHYAETIFRAPFNIDSSDTPDTHANPKNRCIQSASNLSRHPLPFTDSFKQPLLIISSTDIWKSILVDSKKSISIARNVRVECYEGRWN